VVERRFAFPIDANAPVETCQSKDRRRVTLAFTKAGLYELNAVDP
jgi:hypothetical protein